MDWHDGALVLAGMIGSGVAIVHGVLVQRRMIEPLQEFAATRMSRSLRVLVPGLLHFSTFNWFVGGLALLACAFAGGREAKLATGFLVGSSYLYGALGNLWASRGRHPGWVLYGIALFLIAYGIGVVGG
jgi:uncharacterized membrane protein